MSIKLLPSRERGLKYTAGHIVDNKPSSLPSRERGLKSASAGGLRPQRRSLPSRECGLKWVEGLVVAGDHASLPLRERGLKSERARLHRRREWSLLSWGGVD